MRWLAIAGVVLVLLGIFGLIVRVVPVHHREQVAKIGPITATADKETDYYIPTYASVLAMVAGGALVFASRRRV